MRLVTYVRTGSTNAQWGVLLGDVVLSASRDPNVARDAATVRALVELPPTQQAELLGRLSDAVAAGNGTVIPLGELSLLAPIPEPRRNVICVGVNYSDHAAESSTSRPAAPIYFTKATTAVAGDGSVVTVRKRDTAQLDWEVELGVVLGGGGRDISVDDALGRVFGYTVINDVSARDQQHGRPESQWFLGKSFDGSCPMGPCLVTADEIPDPQQLPLRLEVNGITKQDGSTADMIFPVADLIADLSCYMTLLPGDVLATGTPSGVGGARRPPEFLHNGDVMVASCPAIGAVTTRVAVQQS